MPEGAQLLYFHMVQRSDDDGVVEVYPLMKLLGTAPDNFKVLILKGYVRQLNEDQVTVIEDWLEHNKIRADRKVDSIYKKLLLEVVPTIKLIEAKPRSDVLDNSRRIGGQSTDGLSKDKLSKDKLSKDKLSKEASPIGSTELKESFNLFWLEYPRKISKGTAEKAWIKIKPSKELVEKIILSVKNHKNTKQWKESEGKFIPHPTTFLNGKRYEDELVTHTAITSKYAKYS